MRYKGRDPERQSEFNNAVNELKDISEFSIDPMFMGEQTQLVDRLIDFKSKYNIEGNCGITKMLRWSPGTAKSVKDKYDSIKINNGLKNPYKSNTITRLMHTDYYRWRANNYYEEFASIERDVLNARRQGLTLDANEDMAREVWAEFIEKINSLGITGLCRKNSLIKLMSPRMSFNNTRIDMPFIIFRFTLENVNINLITGYNENEKIAGVVPFGKIDAYWEIDLYWWLNCFMSIKARGEDRILYRRFNRNNNSYNGYYKISHFCDIQPYVEGLLHPYVQRNNDSYNQGNTCYGHLQTSLYNSLLNLDIDLFKVLLNQWAGTYHMRDTGPLNNINNSIIGFNSEWPDSMKDRLSVDFNVCERIFEQNYKDNPEKMMEKHCVSCTLTNRCDVYSTHLNPANAEQRRKARAFWEGDLHDCFEHGVCMINFDEDVLPFYAEDVKWEDTNLYEYEKSLIERESAFRNYAFYKHGIPRNVSEAVDMGMSDNTVIDKLFEASIEYRKLSPEARISVTETFKAIYDMNRERSNNG